MATEFHSTLGTNVVAPGNPSNTQPGPQVPAAPQPATAWGKNGTGFRKVLGEEEGKETNTRILANVIRFKINPFVMPKEQPMPLVLLRMIFNHLKNDHRKKHGADDRHAVEQHDALPAHTFLRAFERLFFLLREDESIDLAEYDPNGDGYVTWAEFYDVYKKRNITVKWTLCERIFYTLEDPDSSTAANILSFLILLVIVVSSFCFIFSTVPAFQQDIDHKDGPKPHEVLNVIDRICLVIFVVEYVTRLLTCWNVRTEISRKNQTALVAVVVGLGPIRLPSPLFRVIHFFFAPANLVDLVAILPGVLGTFVDIDGGGFVVLRLIRLTRLFRVLRSRSFIEPVIIIGRTLSQSTSALNILMFNLLLGVVISGSLIYIVEGLGTWDVQQQAYTRVIGQEWNVTADKFADLKEATPFQSIPHSFWWSLVTIMTVGYGDHYPTTGLGKVVAAGTMLFSLVMLALPVGVVGGNFSQVWADFAETKAKDDQMMKQEQQFVVTQMAKLDPDKLSKTMLIEVWDDSGIPCEGMRQGPRWNYFMGQATFHLDMPCDEIVAKEATLQLEQNPDIVDRKIKGYITVKYKWTPDPAAQANQVQAGQPVRSPSGSLSTLHGSLQVTVVSGRGLLNLVHTGSSRRSASSPYCRVYVYPTRPAEGALLTPTVWRTPTRERNLSPVWDVTDTFVYEWKSPDLSPKTYGRPHISSPVHEVSLPESDDKMLDEALMTLQILRTEMREMKKTISTLDQRVAIIAEEEPERLKALGAQVGLQANSSGFASTQPEGESDDGEVPESEPKDLSSVGSEESV